MDVEYRNHWRVVRFGSSHERPSLIECERNGQHIQLDDRPRIAFPCQSNIVIQLGPSSNLLGVLLLQQANLACIRDDSHQTLQVEECNVPARCEDPFGVLERGSVNHVVPKKFIFRRQ